MTDIRLVHSQPPEPPFEAPDVIAPRPFERSFVLPAQTLKAFISDPEAGLTLGGELIVVQPEDVQDRRNNRGSGVILARCVEIAPEGVVNAELQINMPGMLTRVVRRILGKPETGYVFMELVKRPYSNPIAEQNK